MDFHLHNNQKTKEMIVRNNASKIAVASTVIGFNTAEIPRMHKILKRLEPITLPMAISVCPFFAATTLVTSSGREVPIATMVRPINVSLTPRSLARFVAPLTDNSAPTIIRAMPKSNRTRSFLPVPYPVLLLFRI